MIKSFVLNQEGFTCYMEDGSSLTIPLNKAPSTESMIKMMNNIRDHGFTEMINLDNDVIADIARALNLPIDGTKITVEDTVIDVEPIKDLLVHAVDTDSIDPIGALLKRIAKNNRKHSQEDLIDFINHSKFPITANGLILAFKAVNNKNNNLYDVYTGTVLNNVGYRVTIPEEDVDLNRDISCSQGLHICSRSYLSSFNSSALVLVVVDPVDIMTVPHKEFSKVRCKSYDVVHKFDQEDVMNIRSMKDFSKNVWKILNKFIKGTTYKINKEVGVINGSNKHNIKNVLYSCSTGDNKTVTDEYVNVIESNNNGNIKDKVGDIKSATTFDDVLAKFKKNPSKQTYNDLLEAKRKRKKGWTYLGVDKATQEMFKKFQ